MQPTPSSSANLPPPKAHAPGFLKLVGEALGHVREISADQAHDMQLHQNGVLIDVREDREWQAGHAWGAIHLGRGILERDIEGRVPDPSARLLLYCGGGYRSALAADNLQRMGYTNVHSVAGGWRAWRAQELPTSHAPDPPLPGPRELLGGLVWLPRLVEKMRRRQRGLWTGVEPAPVDFDKMTLDFLCVEKSALEAAAAAHADNAALLDWLRTQLGAAWPAEHAVRAFNERLASRRPVTDEQLAAFERRLAQLPLREHAVETYFDLIELEENRLH